MVWELRDALLCPVLGPCWTDEVVLIISFSEKGSEFSTRLGNIGVENPHKAVLLFKQIKLWPKKMEM